MMTDLVTFWHLSSPWLPIIRLILHQNWSNYRLDTLNDTVSALIRNNNFVGQWEIGRVGPRTPSLCCQRSQSLPEFQMLTDVCLVPPLVRDISEQSRVKLYVRLSS